MANTVDAVYVKVSDHDSKPLSVLNLALSIMLAYISSVQVVSTIHLYKSYAIAYHSSRKILIKEAGKSY